MLKWFITDQSFALYLLPRHIKVYIKLWFMILVYLSKHLLDILEETLEVNPYFLGKGYKGFLRKKTKILAVLRSMKF